MNTADSIRVWQGFMNTQFQAEKEKFYELLGSVFIPVTSQIMQPIGLQAYFPGILEYTNQKLPDEIALVVYPSQDQYYLASRDTVIGRAYGKLHGDVFNFQASGSSPASWSNFPVKYTNQSVQAGDCFYFAGVELDWQALEMRCLCFEFIPADNEEDNIHAKVSHLLEGYKAKTSEGTLAEVIISIGETYCLVWLCSTSSSTGVATVEASDSVTLKFDLTAAKQDIKPIWTTKDYGLNVSAGTLLNIINSGQN